MRPKGLWKWPGIFGGSGRSREVNRTKDGVRVKALTFAKSFLESARSAGFVSGGGAWDWEN
jgi:hypothetical protein